MIPENAVELLKLMISYNTVNRAVSGVDAPEQALSKKLASIAEAMGFSTQFYPTKQGYADNLLVTYKVGDDKPWICFDSHLDTVSTEGMTVEPFEGIERDGKLFGRGSCDTKGTGTCMLWAMHELKQSGFSKNNIALLFSADEEEQMVGIKQFARETLKALAIKPIGFVVGEPTMCKPIISHNGMMRFELTTKGVAAHSSDPSKGKSAISDMMKLIHAIETEYIPSLTNKDTLNGNAQMSINTIQGGQSINIIPDQCMVQIDRRIVPTETTQAVMDDFTAFVAKAAKTSGDIEYSLKTLSESPAMGVATDGRLLAGIDQAREKMGMAKEHIGAAFATHGGYLSESGCAAVVIGPGDIAQAHTKDEFIDLAQIPCGIELYKGIMEADYAAD